MKVALIGAGGIGRAQMAAITKHPESELVALCDANPAVMEVPEAPAGARRYTDYQDLLANEQPDAAVVVLPHHLYAEVVPACLERGLHVLKEKPFARDLADAGRMRDAAHASGRLLLVAGQRKFGAPLRKAKEIVDSGSLGDVFLVSGTITYRWARALLGEWGWRGTRALSGGVALIDSGWHILEGLYWLKGRPSRVFASTGSKPAVPGGGYDVDDRAVVTFEYPDGATGTALACFVTLPNEYRIQVHGSRGSLDMRDSELVCYADGQEAERLKFEPENLLALQYAHFAECVLHGADPLLPVEDAYRIQEVIEAGYRSAATGEFVRLEG